MQHVRTAYLFLYSVTGLEVKFTARTQKPPSFPPSPAALLNNTPPGVLVGSNKPLLQRF